jgi:hypothetical protein
MVNFIISKYINDLDTNAPDMLDNLFAILKSNNLGYKDDAENGLIILYNNYDKVIKTDLEKECRSIVLDRNTLKIISYTFDDPLYNQDATHFLLNMNVEDQHICQCYEGTLLSLYYHNGKWFNSTRRLVNSGHSFWNKQSEDSKSHFGLMEDCLKNNGYDSFNEFTKSLKEEYCYYFVIIHHENKNYVDYSNIWGSEYKKLSLVLVRDKETQNELSLYDNITQYFNKDIFSENIFIPQKYDDFSVLENENNKNIIDIPAKNEGLIVKIFDKQSLKYNILKFQTIDYSFSKATNNEKNVFRGFIKLYQINELANYLNNNKIFEQYKKVKDINSDKEYDIIGIVDAVIKVCSSELFELFNYFWDIKSGIKKNNEKYESIPKEYKILLYNVRGIYFDKKAEYISNKKKDINVRCELGINDIYELLKKKTDVYHIINFLKARETFMSNKGQDIYNKLLNKQKDKKLDLTNVYVKLLIKEELQSNSQQLLSDGRIN